MGLTLEEKRGYMRTWRKTHPNYQKNYYQEHKEQRRKTSKIWRNKNRKRFREILRNSSQKRRDKLKKEIFELLGNKCSNSSCLVPNGCTDTRCLQIDHANREAKHREKKNGQATTGSEMYLRYVLNQLRSGSKDFQLLCANCNWIKRWENKEYGKW